MHPKGASKNKDDQAIFSKAGPYLIKPDETKIPSVIPKICKFIIKANKINPKSKIETPKRGIANKDTGIKPIKVLNIAVKVRDIIISLFLSGVMKRFVKFLLHISSRNIIL